MLAYRMDENRNISLEEIEKPDEKDSNIIVEVKCTSLCGTDVRTVTKGSPKTIPPRTLGHEFSGVIVHIGKSISTGLKINDKVTMAPAIGCGVCWVCESGHSNVCDNLTTIGFQEYDGSFAKYIEIPKRAVDMGYLIKLPDNVDFEEGALIEPIGCVLNAHRYVKVTPGDCVAVYGAGFIGCVHAELSFLYGASKVIMIEPSEVRGKQACEFIPGLIWVNPNEVATVERVKEITDGRGANVVITSCSVAGTHAEAQDIAAKMGRISLFGGLVGESKGFIDSNTIHYKELEVSGVHGTTPEMMAEIINKVSNKELDLKKYITKTIDLADIEKGLHSIMHENLMKVVIIP